MNFAALNCGRRCLCVPVYSHACFLLLHAFRPLSGMSVPTEEEIAAAMAKLESPEFQAQLRARAEQAAMAAGGKMSGSRLSHSKVDQSGQQQAVLGA